MEPESATDIFNHERKNDMNSVYHILNHPLCEYPRPQMVRKNYQLLSENWTLNGLPIRLPYPPQAPDSGYSGKVGEILTYETRFSIPESWNGCRILLHFGAVDQVAAVQCNGYEVGRHEGGYLPFTFEITSFLKEGQENLLTVSAVDTLSELYPYGKQSKKPGGMWYTPVSGIWQSVWLEPVPQSYIESVKLTPDTQGVQIEVFLAGGSPAGSFRITSLRKRILPDPPSSDAGLSRIQLSENLLSEDLLFSQEKACLDLRSLTGKAELWEPDRPVLYFAVLAYGEDEVGIYFGLRKIEIRTQGKRSGLFLNDRKIFLHGLLDQGYFPGGIFVPPLAGQADPAVSANTPDWQAYARDIRLAYSLGFNTLRKHVKIEPEQFYYYCDLYGMLVMQDMVNSGHYRYVRDTVLPTIGLRFRKDSHKKTTDEHETRRRAFFLAHMTDTLRHLYNHPCIILYNLFNEGWGQFEADKVFEAAKKADPTRPVNAASGWFAQKKSDFDSRHVYFKDRTLRPGKRPLLLSECGGFGMPVEGHLYRKSKKGYSYGTTLHTPEELTVRIEQMYEKMVFPAMAKGLCGVVYTQITDVEEEVNGLATYDREVLKVIPERMRALAQRLMSI